MLESLVDVPSYRHCPVGQKLLACISWLVVVEYLRASLIRVLRVVMEVVEKVGLHKVVVEVEKIEGLEMFPISS